MLEFLNKSINEPQWDSVDLLIACVIGFAIGISLSVIMVGEV